MGALNAACLGAFGQGVLFRPAVGAPFTITAVLETGAAWKRTRRAPTRFYFCAGRTCRGCRSAVTKRRLLVPDTRCSRLSPTQAAVGSSPCGYCNFHAQRQSLAEEAAGS